MLDEKDLRRSMRREDVTIEEMTNSTCASFAKDANQLKVVQMRR